MEDVLERSCTQKEWTDIIQHILLYLSDKNPNSTTGFYKTERQSLPSKLYFFAGYNTYTYPIKRTKKNIYIRYNN